MEVIMLKTTPVARDGITIEKCEKGSIQEFSKSLGQMLIDASLAKLKPVIGAKKIAEEIKVDVVETEDKVSVEEKKKPKKSKSKAKVEKE